MAVAIAVVVCSRDRPERLRACLPGLVAQRADEILVVDSASATDDTRRVADDYGVRCIRVAAPGLARARNAAMRETSAAVVAFTDDDCIPEPGWSDAIRGRFDRAATEGDRIGYVTGQVLATGGGEPLSVFAGAVPRRYADGDDVSHAGHGANLAIRRDCWEGLGGFDELLGVGGALRSAEDTDLMWRALRAGWIGYFEPRAAVSHEQWRGRLAALHTSYGYGVGAGAVRTKVRRLAGPAEAGRLTAASLRATMRAAARDAGARYEFGVATNLVRAAGIVAGRARAHRLALDHGHLGRR